MLISSVYYTSDISALECAYAAVAGDGTPVRAAPNRT